MRIVSGQYRGKAIVAPPGDATRPTSDRARQAIFNILEHAAWAPELHGARVLDVFAGSGALGLEALSRGAGFCLFVETADPARGAIRELGKVLGRSPTPREVATHMSIDEDLVLQVVEANSAYRTAQLDTLTERQLRAAETDVEVDAVLDRELVSQALVHLRPREREIIQLRFFDELTQAQIADRIGTSQVHVGRLIASSLALLRAHLSSELPEAVT